MRGALARFYLFRGLGLTWVYVPFQWFYLRDHGFSATELMTLNTVFCVAAVLLEVPTGALADRVGPKVVLVLGAAASSLSCVAFVAAPGSIAGLAGANVLAALSMTCISGADSAYLYDLVGGLERPRLYQRTEAGSSAIRLAAAALGGLAAWAIVARGGELSTLYVVTAGLSALAAVLGLSLRDDRRGEPGEASSRRGPWLRSVLSAGADLALHARRGSAVVLGRADLVALLVLSAVLFPVLRVGLFLDQPYMLHLGYATAAVGLAFAAKDLVAAAAAAAVAQLLPLLGERRLFIALPVATCAALLAMGVGGHAEAALLVLVPAAAFGIYSPLVRVYVNRRIPCCRDRATVLSIEGVARRLGFALFSPLVGAVFDLWSLGAAMMVSAAWAAAALMLALLLAAVGRMDPVAAQGGAGAGRQPVPGHAPVPAGGLAAEARGQAAALLARPSSVPAASLVSSDGATARAGTEEESLSVDSDQAA